MHEEFQNELSNLNPMKFSLKLSFNKKNPKKCVYQSPVNFELFEGQANKEFPNEIEKIVAMQKCLDIFSLFKDKKFLALKKIFYFNSKYNTKKLLVETAFGELFRLPSSKQKTLFFSSLFSDLISEELEASDNSYQKTVSFIV